MTFKDIITYPATLAKGLAFAFTEARHTHKDSQPAPRPEQTPKSAPSEHTITF